MWVMKLLSQYFHSSNIKKKKQSEISSQQKKVPSIQIYLTKVMFLFHYLMSEIDIKYLSLYITSRKI